MRIWRLLYLMAADPDDCHTHPSTVRPYPAQEEDMYKGGNCIRAMEASAMNANPVSSQFSNRVHWTTDDIRRKVEQNKVVVFAKGKPDKPRCGLSQEVMSAVDACGRPYEVVDVSEERSILPALKAFAGEKYLPLVYVDGALVSSWDVQGKMLKTGSLRQCIEQAFEPRSIGSKRSW